MTNFSGWSNLLPFVIFVAHVVVYGMAFYDSFLVAGMAITLITFGQTINVTFTLNCVLYCQVWALLWMLGNTNGQPFSCLALQVEMGTVKNIPLYSVLIVCLLASATSQGNKYQAFLRQHQDNPRIDTGGNDYCELLMYHRGLMRPCRAFNSFIHASEKQLRGLCRAGGRPYHGKRQSKRPYPLTTCQLRLVKDGQCFYDTITSSRYLVVSCNRKKLPVQLEENLTITKI